MGLLRPAAPPGSTGRLAPTCRLPPDSDAPADQVPETILFGSAQALFYASPPGPAPSVSTWMYPRIRFMHRSLEGGGAPAQQHP
eukprot:COSAG04_NODE_11397_length_711_cov_1.361111_2_plen_84_part_00